VKVTLAALLCAATVALGQVAPVEILGADGHATRPTQALTPAERSGVPVAPVVALAAGLAGASVGALWAWRRWARLADAERAFLLLSLKSGLRHEARQRVRAAAAERGVSPVAALLNGER
jgi:hypothetical protein